MREAIFSGAFCGVLFVGPLTSRPKIYDLSHPHFSGHAETPIKSKQISATKLVSACSYDP
jgi:hypothetical protein